MALGIKVKEKIARTIGSYFTTNEIVTVFNDKNIPTDTSLYAKWSGPEENRTPASAMRMQRCTT